MAIEIAKQGFQRSPYSSFNGFIKDKEYFGCEFSLCQIVHDISIKWLTIYSEAWSMGFRLRNLEPLVVWDGAS